MVEFRFSPRPNRAHEIHWREWGPEAFEEARRLDRPVLLAISAVWCHWCHVMDETTYTDTRVIELLNQEFIPIRVDNDRHPELNQRYNMGGWPTTAFLTPQGDILTGGTYMPADSMDSVARQIIRYFRGNKAELYSRILEQRGREPSPARAGVVSGATRDAVLLYLDKTHDPEYGGFGAEPKFPQTDSLELLMEEYHRTRDEKWGQMAERSLRAMATGGMFDRVSGGFFRYSTNRDWTIPHYEKMTEDNAALLRVYLHGYQVLGDPEFATVAGRVVEYVLSTLYDPGTGAVYGSQDADEEYYQLPPEVRSERQEPGVDRTVYTPWAAAMASALLEASVVLDRPELREAGLETLRFLWEKSYAQGEGFSHYYDGQAQSTGLLVDQVWGITTMLDAYEVTGEAVYLERSERLASLITERFHDPAGGFFDLSKAYEGIGRVQERDKPLVENSLAAAALLRLSHMTGNEAYGQAAQQALSAFAVDYLRFGAYAAGYARAIGWLLEDPLRVEITGPRETMQPWRDEALAPYHPQRVIRTLDPLQAAAKTEQLGLGAEAGPAAYVCYQQTCSAPVRRPEELHETLERAIERRAR